MGFACVCLFVFVLFINEIDPYRIIYLNVWCLVNGTFEEGFEGRGTALGAGFKVTKAHTIPNVSLYASYMQIKICILICCPRAMLHAPTRMNMDLSSEALTPTHQ